MVTALSWFGCSLLMNECSSSSANTWLAEDHDMYSTSFFPLSFLQVQSLLYENTIKGPKYSHPLFLWAVCRPSHGVSSCCFGSGWGATEKGQAKTFGFQVAESAVGALLQPPR